MCDFEVRLQICDYFEWTLFCYFFVALRLYFVYIIKAFSRSLEVEQRSNQVFVYIKQNY